MNRLIACVIGGALVAGTHPDRCSALNIEFQRWWVRWEKQGVSPSAVNTLMRMNSETNIAGILPIPVPTLVLHRTEDPTVGIDDGRFPAKHIPGAKLAELDGADHIPWLANTAAQIADTILDFIAEPDAATLGPTGSQRILATILFTDIVGSTDHAQALGDKAWRELLGAHDITVRREIARFRGSEVKTLGDGFLAVFDGPARAIRCAKAITGAVSPLGVQVRAGLHTGEVERSESDIQGIAVHLAARIMGEAAAGEVVVSRTVKDLVTGSGIEVDDAGEHFLKGIEQKWQLFRVR
jgi:class 3 adenylate cyclase